MAKTLALISRRQSRQQNKMSTISNGSLASLLEALRTYPHRYPRAAVIARKLAPIVEAMADDDACACCDTLVRVTLNGKKLSLGPLLFNLCYYPDDVYRCTFLTTTCQTVNCVNPRHKTRLVREKRKKRTQVSETDLRRIYPMCLADLELRRVDKMTRVDSDAN